MKENTLTRYWFGGYLPRPADGMGHGSFGFSLVTERGWSHAIDMATRISEYLGHKQPHLVLSRRLPVPASAQFGAWFLSDLGDAYLNDLKDAATIPVNSPKPDADYDRLNAEYRGEDLASLMDDIH